MMKNVQTSEFPAGGMIRSILIIHQGALGDFILALPALETLREAFPRARVVIMGFPRVLELVNQRFYADEILSIDQRGMASFFFRGSSLDPSLSQFFRGFDLLVVFGKDGEGALMSNLKQVSQGLILQINPFPQWTERIHTTDHLIRELTRYGFSTAHQFPRLFLSEKDKEWGKNFCRVKGLTEEEKLSAIVIHPGSGSKKKVWPLDRFIELARYFEKHSNSRVIVVVGPAEGPEVEKAFAGMAGESGGKDPLLVKGLKLIELASVMKGSRLFIGNDSGITHMAAALGIPTIAIFGPSDHKTWSPRGEKVFVVRKKMNCSPCSQEKFVLCKNSECLKEVAVADVLEAIKRLKIQL
ncbi:MAG: glycosyltransferase family 9 protein [Thermodesulfobacteriota bacterium]